MKEKQARCPKCGKPMPFEDEECPFCGWDLKVTRRKKVVLRILAIILLVSSLSELYEGISTVIKEFSGPSRFFSEIFEPDHIDLSPESSDLQEAHAFLFHFIQQIPSSRKELAVFLTDNGYHPEDVNDILDSFQADYSLQARLAARQ